VELSQTVSEIYPRLSLVIENNKPSENRKMTAIEIMRRAIELDEIASTLRHPFTYDTLAGGELEGKHKVGVLFASIIERQRDCLIEMAMTEWTEHKILKENNS
jgi:hypothetical protein